MKLKWALAITIALMLAQTAQAAPGDIYTCVMKDVRGKAIAEEIILAHADNSDSYTVIDGIIDFYEGHPIEATLIKDNDKRIEVKWQVLVEYNLENSPKRVSTSTLYRMVVFRKNNRAQIYAKPPGYTNQWFASGRCARVRGDV